MSNHHKSKEVYDKLKKQALEILETNLGQKRLVEGVQNNNWVLLTCDDKKPYLVKFISDKEIDRLKVEIGLGEYLKEKTDLPVPEIVDYELDQEDPYLLREIIQGQILEEEMAVSQKPGQLFRQAGRFLAQLHSIEFEKKGILTPDISVRPFDLYNEKEYLHILKILHDNRLISDYEYKLLKKVDIDYYYDKKPYVLCHSDYSLKNLIARDCQLVGIIDFEWASSVPFMDDVASFDLFAHFSGYQEYLEYFYQGYQEIRQIPNYYFENLEFYKFYRLITMLSYQVNMEDRGPLEDFYNWMRDELDKYLENDLNL